MFFFVLQYNKYFFGYLVCHFVLGFLQTSNRFWVTYRSLTYNTLCSRGPTKVLALSRINVPRGHLVFRNEAKNIPRQDFMVMNISCIFEKTSYNIFFVRAITANNKRGIWPHSLRYHFESF